MAKHELLVDWDACLGAGGEGEVYLARSLRTGQPYAVKVSVLLDRESAREQLAAELRRCQQAAGDGTVGIVAHNLDAPRPFLVFELADAGTLLDEMRALRSRGSAYHPTRALERIRLVLAALARVHDSGLVHRDVKPANLLRFADTLKLTDFGSSATLDQAGTGGAEDVGTRRYAAQEQRRRAAMDPRADLFSVGCILYEMLTGEARRPVDGAGLSAAMGTSVLVLPELEALVAALLDPQPGRRPASAAEAIARVNAVLARYELARERWQRLGLAGSPY